MQGILLRLWAQHPIAGGVCCMLFAAFIVYVKWGATENASVIWISVPFALLGLNSIFFGERMFANSRYRR